MIEYFKFVQVPKQYSSLSGKITSWEEVGLKKPVGNTTLRFWNARGIKIKELTEEEYEKAKLTEALK